MNRYRARKILKKYGKAAYRSRIEYVNSMLPENASVIGRISWRRMMKRCVMTALIMILTLALLLATASAFGIHILNLSFSEKEDHTEIVGNSKPEKERQEAVFYEPGYIPEGYELVSKENFSDIELEYIYKKNEGKYLYIHQFQADDQIVNINNEGCEIKKEIIQDIEVRIYDYGSRKKIYLLQYHQTFILIEGSLPTEEFEKIICNIEFV